eukprot:SAG22_NODE_2238_length_2804_cov_2.080591_2_plen_178_part_00
MKKLGSSYLSSSVSGPPILCNLIEALRSQVDGQRAKVGPRAGQFAVHEHLEPGPGLRPLHPDRPALAMDVLHRPGRPACRGERVDQQGPARPVALTCPGQYMYNVMYMIVGKLGYQEARRSSLGTADGVPGCSLSRTKDKERLTAAGARRARRGSSRSASSGCSRRPGSVTACPPNT